MAAVMVVEDEDVLLEMVGALIEDNGHRAILATNGREALQVLTAETEPPLLIISDIMMPLMNGIVLAETLKRDVRYRHVPLVLMSAGGRPPAAGLADHYLSKPFDLEHIETLIQQYALNSDMPLIADSTTKE